VNNVRCKASRTIRNKKTEHLKEKMNKLETNKNENMRDLYGGINKYKTVYQPRTDIVKNENGDLLTDSHSILNRRKDYFCQLLNIHDINNVGQTQMHTAEQSVLKPISFEGEISSEML
jgi:hypothetical protein